MPYGIANKTGQPDLDSIIDIVETAWAGNIREFDTAQAYDKSERLLGEAISKLGINNEVRVITKLQPKIDHSDDKSVRNSVVRSLHALKVPSLYGLMLHKQDYIKEWEMGIGDILMDLVRKGLTAHIGAALYSPGIAKLALETDGIDMIQIPSNILDRRFEKAGVFELAENRGKQIYVRSVFLQGLLLIEHERIPPTMQFAVEVLDKLEAFSQETGLSKQDLALGYVRQAYPQAKIVFGVEMPEQIICNLKSWQMRLPAGFVAQLQKEFRDVEEKILNPVQWPN